MDTEITERAVAYTKRVQRALEKARLSRVEREFLDKEIPQYLCFEQHSSSREMAELMEQMTIKLLQEQPGKEAAKKRITLLVTVFSYAHPKLCCLRQHNDYYYVDGYENNKVDDLLAQLNK